MIEYKDTSVTVSVGEKEFSKSYQQIVKSSVSVDDMLAMLQDEKAAKQVISDWHYGNDLRKKAEVRAEILKEAAGPEKSIEKAVKGLMGAFSAMGKTITEEQARELVKAQLDAAAQNA